MKVMLDTNVLISALVFGGKTKLLLENLILSDQEIFVSQYVCAEFNEKLKLKWPDKAERVYSLYHSLPFIFCKSTSERTGNLRDKKDIPILNDALFLKADIIVSGDKDFLEAGLENPQVFSPSMLYDYLSAIN